MSAFTDKRAEVEARLTTLEQEVHRRLAEAGATLVDAGILPQEEPYATAVERERALDERVRTLESTRERIVAIGERLAEIASAREEREKRRRAIAAEIEPHYATIGENAFRVFRDNPLVDQEYADIFTPVLDAHEEIRQLHGELARAEKEVAEKPFLEKMVLRGRMIVLRNRVAMKDNQRERLLKDAGRQIAATDFITTIGDPGLDEAAAPFLELHDELRQVDQELASIDEERAALDRELEKLGVERKPATRIGEIDAEIRELTGERDEVRVTIATAAKGSELVEKLGAGDRETFEAIERSQSERDAARATLERIEAAIRVEKLQHEHDRVAGQIDRKQKQIASLSSEIEGLQQEKSRIEAETAELEAQRGPVADLIG